MENSKSTQISDIIGNDEEEQNNELVQEIINEIQMQEEENQEIQEEVQNEQENDDIGGLLEKKVEEIPRSNQQIKLDYHPVLKDENETKPKDTTISKITSKFNLQTLKETAVVISLLFLLSMSFVNKNITKLIPKLGNDMGEINMGGLLVKALVGGLIFFIVKLVL